MTTGKPHRDLLNELPRSSPWPARLLGVERWAPRDKSPTEVAREFEEEKWGAMLRHFQESQSEVSLDAADAWIMGDAAATTAAEGDILMQLSVAQSQTKYRELVASSLRRYLRAPAIIELGAGYGSVVIDIARRSDFGPTRILAAELTESGRALIQMLARAEHVEVSAGRCDLRTGNVSSVDVPPGSILYTAYSACYVSPYSPLAIDKLAALRPKVVVHIEPVYEHCDPSTLLGLMRRRYIEVNGYNTDLATVLQEVARAGRIRILEERRSVYGPNPFLVASVIAWTPV